MRLKTSSPFTAVRTEGAILPADLLQRIVEGDKDLRGLSPDSYHLATGERINEAINRSWNRLQGAWTGFKGAREKLAAGDPGTGMTRDRWLMVFFQELAFGRLVAAKGIEVDGKSYPISHVWQNTPIHLVGCGVDLDRRAAGVAGAAHSSPHSLVQEYLNRTEDHLWGFVSNGLRLRVLRDNASLVRQAFVEFDLESMMEGEVYSDFVLLWLLCHQSRVEVPAEGGPGDCWLEKWSKSAGEQGTRALEGLRAGVESAIAALGRGFLVHPANSPLRDKLQSGDLSPQEYYRQLLRICYRLIFLFVAEDRELLLNPSGDLAAKDRYMRFFSAKRLRQIAGSKLGTKHGDLFQGLKLIMQGLGSEKGIPGLALSPLGSFLWSEEAIASLNGCLISNRDLLDAIRVLAFGTEAGKQRPVDYANLGSEELGSIYESLLELHPELDIGAGQFALSTASGHERRTTGSYYTPTSLISELLNTALDPLISDAMSKPNPEHALLSLKVVDPATGSGHFLIAAANRIAKAVAAVRTNEDEPSPDASRTALRDVIGRCLYGVDLNEMAVELCKVSLWMEALEPGKPLSFLDHRIRCGNSLIGATPALIDGGIPEDAFKPIEGDDKELAAKLKARNKKERAGQGILEMTSDAGDLKQLSQELARLDALADASISDVQLKERKYAELRASTEVHRARMIAHAWCAAFLGRKAKNVAAVTDGVLWQLRNAPEAWDPDVVEEILRLVDEYKFFHWHLEFPDVLSIQDEGEGTPRSVAGWSGGFDVVVGNPPWERVKLQEREWFSQRRPEIASARTAAARRKKIKDLADEDPTLFQAYREAVRKSEATSKFLRHSDRYPLCGRGDVNLYAVFAETDRILVNSRGRVGCVLPSGIATDATTSEFFQDLVATRTLVSRYDFENRKGIFPAVQGNVRFSLLTLSAVPQEAFRFAAQLDDPGQLHDPDRVYELTLSDIERINPNTLTAPAFFSRGHATRASRIYSRLDVFVRDGDPSSNSWNISFLRMFDMTNDARLFRTFEDLHEMGCRLQGNRFVGDSATYLPLYEAKLAHHYNHRLATFEGVPTNQRFGTHAAAIPSTADRLADPEYVSLPRYWVSETEVKARYSDQPSILVFRNAISAVADARSLVSTILPFAAVGNALPVVEVGSGSRKAAVLSGILNSFVMDYVLRQKTTGGNLNFFIFKQLPVPPEEVCDEPCPWAKERTLEEWALPRILELTYTSNDIRPFARDLGYEGAPFEWNKDRRTLIIAELNAACFHLYGMEHEDVDQILETFPVVRRRDEAAHGAFRTKQLILRAFEAMARVSADRDLYESMLTPEPAI